jgi:hypothetical protein
MGIMFTIWVGIEYFGLVAALHLGYLGAFILPAGSLKKFVWTKANLMVLAAFGAAMVYLLFDNTGIFLETLRVLADHLFTRAGLWGATWIVLSIALIISLFLPRLTDEKNILI